MTVSFNCSLCKNKFTHDEGRYEGHILKLYGNVFCCDRCWTLNHDGWNPHHEERLMKILKERGIPTPPRNEKGFLPRD
jgi:hypothetical protein